MSEISEICRSYRSPLVRAYAAIRFQILRQRFLEEIGQYLPRQGRILDVGCGFGLFSLFFARESGRDLRGFDLDRNRIEAAKTSAARLKILNAHFEYGDARSVTLEESFDAAFMLDIIHHIPPQNARTLLEHISSRLTTQGVLIVKDVAARPAYKRWFTFALDKFMDYKTPVHYWEVDDLRFELLKHFKTVHVHAMIDYLPYPHVIYICRK
jgi:2-polyprenyl-3-methyl-5-hydroxy-6-metoxy-1,4-benzoquinol methylase